ncbi:hypothetical protein [Pseudomonas syringae group genomosp. 3]|nr:hypothetical protein [Pseudomonas syringae group genomosp. 3]
MKGKQLSDLAEVFVSFEVEKLDGCSVVYFNKVLSGAISSADVLDAYGYVVGPEPRRDFNQFPLKSFMAERYGGDGILNNGGGGRCGFDGVWQLKGVGPNQLVGSDIDPSNVDGNLCLNTAIYETIWSEIIQVILPFGAIQTVAILDTGREYESCGILKRRGLLIRQPAVRPAHFIRATYFREKQLNALSKDAQRVKLAVRRLEEFLPGSATVTCSAYERIELGLLELVKRYAEQFAVSNAKHIAHLNVTASNLSLDGAWLDLSGACLFTHLNIRDKLAVDRFNGEHIPAICSLQDICYYLCKYSVINYYEFTILREKITKGFEQSYFSYLKFYQVAQAGFPCWVLKRIESSKEFALFSDVLSDFLKHDGFLVNPITLGECWAGYERWVARLYLDLLKGKVDKKPADFSWLNADASIIDQLLSGFSELFDRAVEVADGHHVSLQNLYRCMLINITRLNRSHELLHGLKDHIERIGNGPSVDRHTEYHELKNEAVRVAKFNFSIENIISVSFWCGNESYIWFDPMTGMFTARVENNHVMSSHSIFELAGCQKDVKTALRFYREIWSDFNEK